MCITNSIIPELMAMALKDINPEIRHHLKECIERMNEQINRGGSTSDCLLRDLLARFYNLTL